MATYPQTPNPQAPAPQPGGGASPSPQGNPLKDMLGKLVQVLHTLANQNTVIQEPVNKAVMSLVQAIQLVDQASPGPPQQAPAPPQM